MKLIFGLLVLVAPVAFADDGFFTDEDIFELEVAADPQVSPDGSQVAYVRNSMDIMSDQAVPNIWVVDADGRNHRPILSGAGGFSSPRWSPRGDRLAYVTSVEGRGPQIHIRWMDTGQTAELTNVRDNPSSLAWSPDGTQIAFGMFVPAKDEPLATPPDMPEGANWAPPVKVITKMPYRFDGDGYMKTGNVQIFVLSAEGGTPRQLTHGDYDHDGPLAWTRDGKRIILSANRQEDSEHDPVESELWAVTLDDGKMARLTDRNGPDFSPHISPDGAQIAYLGFDDMKMGYQNSDVYVMNLDGGESRNLTAEFDRNIDDVQWAGSANRLLVRYEDHGRVHVASLSMNGELTSVVDDVGGVDTSRPYTSGGFSVSGNGVFAYSSGTTSRPADVSVGRAGRGSKQVTNLNDDLLAHKSLAAVQEITWRSTDDAYDIQGWLVTPPEFNASKKYPMILEIHGGPFAAYGPNFSAEDQLYAAAGYVVLYANPRGSTSYGYDFANEIHHNYPGPDYDDLMAGVDAVISKGFVDEDHLYVTGGSGGGVLTAWIVGKTNRFRAAVVAKPVINWISFTLTADGTHFFARYWFEKMPWETPDAYWERSPLSLVGNVSTPTALLTGEQDFRTPISESEQFYQALKLRKIDTALIRIPEASHGIAGRPSHQIAKVDNILAWFERYSH